MDWNLEGLLAMVGLEVMTEGIKTGTGTERWRERVPKMIEGTKPNTTKVSRHK